MGVSSNRASCKENGVASGSVACNQVFVGVIRVTKNRRSAFASCALGIIKGLLVPSEFGGLIGPSENSCRDMRATRYYGRRRRRVRNPKMDRGLPAVNDMRRAGTGGAEREQLVPAHNRIDLSTPLDFSLASPI
ncbi:MAG: hypothetical protein ACLFS8_02320 [Clostridia bacterium]